MPRKRITSNSPCVLRLTLRTSTCLKLTLARPFRWYIRSPGACIGAGVEAQNIRSTQPDFNRVHTFAAGQIEHSKISHRPIGQVLDELNNPPDFHPVRVTGLR